MRLWWLVLCLFPLLLSAENRKPDYDPRDVSLSIARNDNWARTPYLSIQVKGKEVGAAWSSFRFGRLALCNTSTLEGVEELKKEQAALLQRAIARGVRVEIEGDEVSKRIGSVLPDFMEIEADAIPLLRKISKDYGTREKGPATVYAGDVERYRNLYKKYEAFLAASKDPRDLESDEVNERVRNLFAAIRYMTGKSHSTLEEAPL